LKILSRITAPTTGRTVLHGRVASLLEVGTGFHPDLTGRENIFLNGAILGMSRTEIRRKFDEIVAFAEVERFLDTPVKRYSSGMYVRLAFAVAAHLEPEILIVDEVLAVGDAQFQAKCLGKMRSIATQSGRTVLFVSHNMSAVAGLCQRVFLLESGRLVADDVPEQVIPRCFRRNDGGDGRYVRPDSLAKLPACIQAVELRDSMGRRANSFENGRPFTVAIEYALTAGFRDPLCPSIAVRNLERVPLFQHHSRLNKEQYANLPAQGELVFRLAKLPLPAGTYQISVALVSNGRLLDHTEDVLDFHVVDGVFYAPGEYSPSTHGVVLVEGEWAAAPSSTARPMPQSAST
jgi:lipopolysaccharide transport system ATP-binding protein